MAYVLGFIVADGCLTKNKRGAHFLTIESTDKEILYAIRDAMSSNVMVSEYASAHKNWNTRYRLQLGSKEMFDDLTSLGVTPRKSKTIELPNVPDRYFSHFLRGYFDGDGCVSVCTYQKKDRKTKSTIITSGFTSGSYSLLKNIKDKLTQFNIIQGGTLYFSGRGYRIYFSTLDSLRLWKFIYKDVAKNLFLERKRKVFEIFFKNRYSTLHAPHAVVA